MDCVYDSFHDLHTFKDGRYRAADVDIRVEEIAATLGENKNLSQIFVNDVLGGKLDKKKMMFGTGNLAKSLVGGSSAQTMPPGMNAHASAGLDPYVRAEIREELRQELSQELHQELREELRQEIYEEFNVDREQRTKIENDVAMQKMVKQLMTSHKSSYTFDGSAGI
ncbi:hypothetical protein AAHA92_24448 [Salvia divinorum]|uniref:Uncharacterized protein n=1 Tax=Salvia divinorum TaxID=28513 RepID=A0ABD1G7E7_SALDI